MAAERIHKALDPAGGIEGAVRVLELHPLFNPAAYVSADVGPDSVARAPVARPRGRRLDLVGRPRRATRRCRRSSRQSTRTSRGGSGTETDWTVRVIETDTAAKELPEVAVCKFSGGCDVGVRGEKSLPLTVV